MKATTLAWALSSIFLVISPLLAQSPPNFVFIMADDLGWADVAFHGGSAPTPHLDKLAAEGLELTQHYVAPVCSPTRTGLLTGRCWSRFGVTNPQNERALPWDTLTLPREVAANAALIPGAEHHCFADAGHSLLLESAPAFDRVCAFLRERG